MRWLTKRGAAREGAPEKPKRRREPVDHTVDDFSQSYARWREACEDLRTAYELWSNCAPRQRILAFDGYCAALDREERAAFVHSHLAKGLRPSAS